jgi:hypothetical protein
MIARIVVSRPGSRTVVPMSRLKEDRRTLAGVIKHSLFPTNALYGRAKRRGQAALNGGAI